MKDFKRALAGVAEVYGEPLTADRIRAYSAILSEYQEADLVKALKQHCLESEFFPRPAALVKILRSETRNPEAEANMAWGKVQAVLDQPRLVSELVKTDDRIKAGIDTLGGWYTMCHSDEDPRWMGKRFISAFLGRHQAKIIERRRELPRGGVINLQKCIGALVQKME